MARKVAGIFLCLLCLALPAFPQASKAPRIRSISLRHVTRHANNYTPHTLKISNVVLEDVRKLLDVWDEYGLQLYDPRADFRLGIKGEKTTFDPYGFLICVDELGEPLIKQKEKWLNQRVTLYLQIRDMALTTNLYVGYVAKIELLNWKGTVVDTLVASRRR